MSPTTNEPCQWFALCVRTATGTMSHPILGEVPICTECKEKMDRIEGSTHAKGK